MKFSDLTTDNGYGRQRIPESRQSVVFSIISECSASSLQSVHQRYQTFHYCSLIELNPEPKMNEDHRSADDPPTTIRSPSMQGN